MSINEEGLSLVEVGDTSETHLPIWHWAQHYGHQTLQEETNRHCRQGPQWGQKS